jgi:hypothetical protein
MMVPGTGLYGDERRLLKTGQYLGNELLEIGWKAVACLPGRICDALPSPSSPLAEAVSSVASNMKAQRITKVNVMPGWSASMADAAPLITLQLP